MKKPNAGFYGSSLRVGGAIIEAANSRMGDCTRTHGAGLNRDIEIAVGKTVPRERFCSRAKDKNLRVRGGILVSQSAVSGTGNDFAILHDDSAHRHLARAHRGDRHLQRQIHEIRLAHSFPARSRANKPRFEFARTIMTRKPEENDDKERIAKVMARAGLCSRREAETWIAVGRVSVNGVKLTTPAFTVSPSDKIVVDGKPLPTKERTRLFLYHKPKGLVTTNRDERGRPTIFQGMPKHIPRVVSVGRLDLNSEGLLLLTNDGGLARILELPETGWLRRYRVRANGRATQEALDRLAKGITVEGIEYGPIKATLDRTQGSNVWVSLGLREGKNREVRNVLRALDLYVNRLIRVSYGPFQLGELEPGAIEEVNTRALRDQLGSKLERLAGADFTAPVRERESEPLPLRKRPERQNSDRPKFQRKPERAKHEPEKPGRPKFYPRGRPDRPKSRRRDRH